MADIRVKDLGEASVPGTDYYLLTDSATDGVKKVKTTNVVKPADIGAGATASPLSQFAATTSAQLAGVISDETGTGALVFATSPTLVTPTLGAASATSINKVAVTTPLTGATLTIADGRTLQSNVSILFTGQDGKTLALDNGIEFATIGNVDNTVQTFPGVNGTVVTSATSAGGDLTGSYPSPTIGATKVTSAMLNADVFSTAHSWSGVQTFTNPIVGTQTVGDNSTKAASTAFVAAAVSGVGTSLANPAATIGLTAVNGAATSALRSDGAPALSQAIAPTWTGQHKFTVFPTQIGTSTTSGNDTDPAFQINRDVDNTGSGNAHGASDNSTISRTTGGPIGYNSFDGRVTYSGTGSFDHYAGFQSLPTFSTSGTLNLYHGTLNGATVTAGTVTNAYLHHAQDIAGAGSVTNQYGFYADSLTKGGTLNYAFYSAGTTPSKFGGNVDVGGLSVGGVDAAGVWTAFTPTVTATSGTITTVSASGYYKKIGKTVIFSVKISVTTNGTGAGFLLCGLPFTLTTKASNIQQAFTGLKSGFFGLTVLGALGASSMTIGKYDGTYPATNGDALYISGVYETD